ARPVCVVEAGPQLSALVNQVNVGRMIDVIAEGRIRLLDLVPGAVLSDDGINLLLLAGQGNCAGREILDVVPEDLSCITIGINADKDCQSLVRIRAELLEDAVDAA